MLTRYKLSSTAVLFFALFVLGCSVPKGTIKERRGERFDSPDAALAKFKAAFNSGDPQQLVQIFGEEGRDIIVTGDPVADRAAMRRISRRLDQRAQLIPAETEEFAGEQWYKLRYGIEGWNMRIPLVNAGDGWYFATHHAKDAAQSTRIAINELTAMHTLVELVAAERKYYEADRDGDGHKEYAQQLISTEGKRDGLYWPSSGGDTSPLDRLVNEARSDDYTKTAGDAQSYEGYRYKILFHQGRNAKGGSRSYVVGENMTQGFAIMASPREWNKSGTSTYVIDMTGRMYKRDLGFRTNDLADDISIHDPDSNWNLVDRSYYGDDIKLARW